MKTKFAGLLVIPLLITGLTSCLSEEDYQAYADYAVGVRAICATSGGGIPLISGENAMNNLLCDNSDNVEVFSYMMTKPRGYDKSLRVDFSWSWDEKYNDYLTFVPNSDPDNDAISTIEINFDNIPDKQSVQVSFSVTASIEGMTASAVYNANAYGTTLEFDEYTIEELYQTGSDGKYFWINKTNNDSPFYYVKTRGYVVGYLPDGNTALIADGEHYMTLYAGSGTALLPANYRHLTIGNLIEVRAETAGYFGAPQLSYVNAIRDIPEEENTTNVEMPAETIDLTDELFKTLSQFDGYCHRPVQFEGRFLGQYKDQNGNNIDAFTPGARCVFGVQVGSVTVNIAYNYHVNRGDAGIGDAYAAVLANVKRGDTLKIKGTLNFNSGVQSGWESTADAAYEVMPWNEGDIALAAA